MSERESWMPSAVRIQGAMAGGWPSVEREIRAAVERALAEQERKVRRATLQEAARAVCSRCKAGPLAAFDYDGWYHETPRGAESCNAPEIHDLIAALDKEGS